MSFLDKIRYSISKYGLTTDELFEHFYRDKSQPVDDNPTQCICGHDIRDNYHIKSDKYPGIDLIVGSECIKKYGIKQYSTCSRCGDKYKNKNMKSLIDKDGLQIYACLPCRKIIKQEKSMPINERIVHMWDKREGLTNTHCSKCDCYLIDYSNNLYCPLCIKYTQSYMKLLKFKYENGIYKDVLFIDVLMKDMQYIKWTHLKTTMFQKFMGAKYSMQHIKQTIFYAKKILDKEDK